MQYLGANRLCDRGLENREFFKCTISRLPLTPLMKILDFKM